MKTKSGRSCAEAGRDCRDEELSAAACAGELSLAQARPSRRQRLHVHKLLLVLVECPRRHTDWDSRNCGQGGDITAGTGRLARLRLLVQQGEIGQGWRARSRSRSECGQRRDGLDIVELPGGMNGVDLAVTDNLQCLKRFADIVEAGEEEGAAEDHFGAASCGGMDRHEGLGKRRQHG